MAKHLYIDVDDVMEQLGDMKDREMLAQITINAMQAAVQAAIPAVIQEKLLVYQEIK